MTRGKFYNEMHNHTNPDVPNYELTVDDFDLSNFSYIPIIRIYDGFWIILAQSEQDYQNKVNCIRRGDRKGFLKINTAKRRS